MATKLYFHAATTGVAGTLPASNVSVSATSPTQIADGVNHTMNRTIGVSQTSIVLTTNGTANAQPSLIGRFVSDRLASQTFALTTIGDISLSIAGAESNAGSNFQVRISLATWRPSTGALVTRIHDLATNATAEPGTTQTSLTATNAAGGTSATVADGDILICEVWRDSTVPGATTARTNTIFYDGTTEASITTNAAFINFPNDTLTFAPQQFTQTQADIKQTYNQFTQTQTDIKATYNQFTQAQAKVIILSTGFTQAQGLIDGTFSTVVDTFTRTVSNGWGTADTGGDWTRVTGTASNFNTNGSVGTIVTAGTENRIDLGSVSAPRNTEFTFQFSINSLPSSVLNVSFHVHLGSAVTLNNTSYQFRTLIASSGLVSLLAIHGAGSVTTTSATVVPGDLWNVKGRLLRTDSTGFMVSKLWKVGDSEPEFSTNLTFSEVGGTPRGHVGFDNPGSVSTPITFTFDNLNLYQAFPVAHTQAQTSIKQTYNQFTQTQAKINAFNVTQFTQSQADIKATNNQFIQAQACIFHKVVTFTQAGALIGGTFSTVVDPFTRTISNGWGTADTGGNWEITQGTVSDFNVNGSTASLLTQAFPHQIRLGSVAAPRNLEFTYQLSIDSLPSSGNVPFNLTVHSGSSDIEPDGSEYVYKIVISTTGVTTLSVAHAQTGTNVGSGTIIAGDLWNFKGRLLRTNSSMEMAYKLWKVGNSEPPYNDPPFSVPFNMDESGGPPRGHIYFDSSGSNIRTLTIDNFNLYQVFPTQSTQAQGSVAGVTAQQQFIQTQANIKAVGQQYTQSQADIKAVEQQFTQSQADIKQTYNQFTQSQADIKATSNQFVQSQADIKTTYNQFTQANSRIILAQSAYERLVRTTAGIQSYWKLDEINGTSAYDYVGSITGTHVGTVTKNVTPSTQLTGTGITVVGTGNKVTAGDNYDFATGSNAIFSVEAWVKTVGTAGNYIVSKLSGLDGWFIGVDPEGTASFNLNTNLAVSTTSINDGNWYHIVGTTNGVNIKVYVNGILYSGASSNTLIDTTALLTFGGNSESTSLDEIAIYNTALSVDDIQAHYTLAKSGAIVRITQAQASIKQTSNQFTQTQADIKTTTNQFTQSQADIKVTSNQFTQTQADIKATNNQFTQSQAFIHIAGTYEKLVIHTAGIESYWRLDEASGTFARDTVGAKHGTYIGGTLGTTPATVLDGTALTLSGSNTEYVEMGNIYPKSGVSFSVEAWVKLNATGIFQAVVSNNDGTIGWLLYITSANKIFFATNGIIGGSTSLSSGVWYHLVTVLNISNGICTIYLNGVVDGQDSFSIIGSNDFRIGQLNDGSLPLNGSVDEVAIYSTTLSSDDIQAHYTVAKTGAVVRIFQAQSSIKTTVNQFTQAQTDIKATGQQFSQSQADIKATEQQYLQTQTDIKATYNQFTQTQADIKQTYVQCTQAQTYIILSGQNQFTQSQADIKQTYQQYEQAQADIKQTYNQFMQSQADIKAVEQNYWQAQADIKQTYVQCTQSQASIKTTDVTQFTQAQADINQTYQQFLQSQADIKATYNQFTQAQADIKATEQAYWQAQGSIKQTYNQFTQAQTLIKTTDVNQFTQAQAYIKTVDNCQFTQAQADIKATGQQYAQSQGKINAFNVMQFTQAQGNVASSGNFGPMQAQAKINAFGYPQFTQSQADIKATGQAYTQAQADVKQTYQQYVQSQADIKQTYNQFTQTQSSVKATYNQFCQAQADIKQTGQNYWQAQGQISSSSQNYWQAQADINATSNAFMQAQSSIKTTSNKFYQAQADIKVTQQSYTQAQAYVKIIAQQYEQAQASIKVTTNTYMQAQATILATSNKFFQAQASIKNTYQQYTSAQANIKATNINVYQAQGYIKTINTTYTQAQGYVQTFALQFTQAQALIALGAAFFQAQAMITQPHTLKHLRIADIIGIKLKLRDKESKANVAVNDNLTLIKLQINDSEY